ncbi:MAG TPA: hypothetical protein VLG50_07165 [Candidatus Saccharimonadales bacterium]|nr:hypothetical protein [Candidatus Saccharimonadales bacterium]
MNPPDLGDNHPGVFVNRDQISDSINSLVTQLGPWYSVWEEWDRETYHVDDYSPPQLIFSYSDNQFMIKLEAYHADVYITFADASITLVVNILTDIIQCGVVPYDVHCKSII